MRGEADQPGFRSELQRTHGSLTNPNAPPFQVTDKFERGTAPDTKAERWVQTVLVSGSMVASPAEPHEQMIEPFIHSFHSFF